MKAQSLEYFLQKALNDPAMPWKPEDVQHMGTLQVPEQIFGEYPALFRGDIHRLWAEWFLGSCVDVDRFATNEVSYGRIYKEVQDYCTATFGSRSSVSTLAKSFARLIDNEIQRVKASSKRETLSLDNRQLMVDLADGKPRCWICGYEFLDEAVDNFLAARPRYPLPRPLLIDIFKPIGLFARDMQIEVDHVHPFSKGGGNDDNLRIACGWCNRHKSSYSSLYDTAGVDRRVKIESHYYSLPQPLWVIRLLALSGPSACSGKTTNTELTVTLRTKMGKATPPNLLVVTPDAIPPDQMQNFDMALKIVTGRNSIYT